MTSLIRIPVISSEPYTLPIQRSVSGAGIKAARNFQPPKEIHAEDSHDGNSLSGDPRGEALEQAGKRILQLEQELRRLQDSVQSARQAAITEGFEQGRKEGAESIERDRLDELKQLRQLVCAFEGALSGKLLDAEDMAVEVAFTSVRKILGDAYLDRNGIASVVRQVMEDIDGRGEVRLRVSPDDYQKLMQLDSVSIDQNRRDICRVVPDDSVGAGGCVIDTEFGSLDASLDTQLSILRDILLDVRRGTIHDA